MDAQELIQVNLQIPASALDSLARLTEQLRMLTAPAEQKNAAGTRQILEQGENRSFDPEQFRALRQDKDMTEIDAPPAAGPDMEPVPDAVPVRPEMKDEVYSPADAGREINQNVEDPAQAGPPAEMPEIDAETVGSGMQDGPSAETIQQDAERVMDEIPAVQAENNPISDPEMVQAEPESQVPDKEAVREQMELSEYDPPFVQSDVSEEIAPPVNAGFSPAPGPDMPQSRWTGTAETLVPSVAAPLTAEDVSLAFQRDERRYDNGFPLY